MRDNELRFGVAIDGFDDEGRGRAVLDGWDVAVRGAFPGDVASIRVERVFAARRLAQCVAIDADGPLHVERDCAHAAPCPGCPLEGAPADFAHDLKRARVAQAFADVGVDPGPLTLEPARAPRQKVKLTAGLDADWRPTLGLYAPHTHALADATRCPHQHPALTRALARVAAALFGAGPDSSPGASPFRPSTGAAGVKAVIARAFVEGVGVVVVTGAPVDGAAWRVLGGLVEDTSVVDGIRAVALRVDADGKSANSLVGGTVERWVGPQTLTPLEGGAPASVDAFCQADPTLAAHLYARVAAFLTNAGDASGGGVFLDAYAGAGGFARALVEAGAGRVVAVERARPSVDALRAFNQSGALPPGVVIDVVESSVEDALASGAVARAAPFVGVVLDPPKSGLKEAAAALAAISARRLALVACDPDAGARDVRAFVDAGWRLVGVELLDLFPGTPEVETLCLLTR